MLKLNLGPGTHEPLNGYVNIDLRDGCAAYPLTGYGDGTVDEIRASHILEHFSHRQIADVLADWVRVLKPGGLLRIAVPDLDKLIALYQGPDTDPLYPYVIGFMVGGQEDENDVHRCLFNRDTLERCLTSAGLVDVRDWTSEIQDCASLPISLNLCGRKPEAGEAPRPAVTGRCKGRVAAYMSLPNLCWTDNMFCALSAFVPLGIALEKSSGVFWGQCMQNMLARGMVSGKPYLLTLDYDTVFTAQDVEELVRILDENPEIDAVCPLQMKRDEDASPLLSLPDHPNGEKRVIAIDRADLAKETMAIGTGHFGLTVLRASALRDMPLPWFEHRANPQSGAYDDGRIDDDIFFWRKWTECGKTLHVALRVPVGHMQRVVSWPDMDMHTYHQFLSEYQERGKPVERVWK